MTQEERKAQEEKEKKQEKAMPWAEPLHFPLFLQQLQICEGHMDIRRDVCSFNVKGDAVRAFPSRRWYHDKDQMHLPAGCVCAV